MIICIVLLFLLYTTNESHLIHKNIRNLQNNCPKGYYPKDNSCYACFKNCFDCDGIKCNECEKGYYPNEMNCFECYDNCLDCDGISCLRCKSGYYPSNMNCYTCYENCFECDGKKCLNCAKGYYPVNMDCYKCHDNCLECNENECLKCEDGYSPFKTECYAPTKEECNNNEGFYLLKKDFLELLENKDYLFFCLDKYIIGNGYFINSGKIDDKTYKYWEECSKNCMECVDSEENNCTECDGINYFKLYENKESLKNFKCYTKEEKPNYFLFNYESKVYLRKCSENCLTCINEHEDKCTSCDNKDFFIKYEDIPNVEGGVQCYNQFQLPDYYLYMNLYFKECKNICTTNNCDKSCSNCLVTDKSMCISCNIKENYYPLKSELNGNSNYYKCYLKNDYPHYFVNETDKTLEECSITCKTCFDNSYYCRECSENAYRIQGNYDFNCSFYPPGINWVLNTEKEEWQKCNKKCYKCFKQTNSDYDQQCTSCNNNDNYFAYQKDIDAWNNGNNKYKMTGFNCYTKDEIFDGYFLDSVNLTWAKCDKSCKICESQPKNCLECNHENEFYNIKNFKNGTCFKNPLPGYILNPNLEFTFCFRTCKFCQTVSDSFLYMQCRECDEIKYTIAKFSYESSFCVPKDNSSSYYLKDQLKWYISGYNISELSKIYDYEKLNDPKYENYDYNLTFKCPKDKPFIIYSLRQCVSKCSNPDDLIEYGLFFYNKPLYVYNNICYDECPYGSFPDNKTMTCVEENKYILENYILKSEFQEYYQKNIDIYLGKSANNTIFQIHSTEFTNFFYNSSTNNSWKYQQNMPIFDLEECISLLCEKYNYSKYEIHIGIFQNNDLKKDYYNKMLLSAINSTSYKLFLENGTLINFSICKNINMEVRKPVNVSLISSYLESIELLKNYNLSIFDTENEAFKDICIPLELNGKDISIFTRQNKLKSKIKVCDKNCKFKRFDYQRNYSLCECKIMEEENENNMNYFDLIKENNEALSNTLNMFDKSNIKILKCIKRTKFDKRNYVFYMSIIFFALHIIFLCLSLQILCEKKKIRRYTRTNYKRAKRR